MSTDAFFFFLLLLYPDSNLIIYIETSENQWTGGLLQIPCTYNQHFNTFIVYHFPFIPLHVSFGDNFINPPRLWLMFFLTSFHPHAICWRVVVQRRGAESFVLHPAPAWGWTCLYIDRNGQQESLKCQAKGTGRFFVLSGTVQSGISRLTWQDSQNPVRRWRDSDPTFSIYVHSELLEILELCSKPAWGLWDPTANFMIAWAPASNWLHSKPPCTSCVTTCGKSIVSGSLGFLICKMKCK